MRAGVLIACAALPSGRDEAIAFGISAAVNEMLVVFLELVCGVLTLKLSFSVE